MKLRLFLATAVAATATATAVVAPGLAAGAEAAPVVPSTGKTDTVFIRDGKAGLRFVAPKTVSYGDELKVVNQTNPKQVGPHTFSLVEPSLVPKTPKARQLCFTKGHICKAIAIWQGVKGNGPPTINPAEAGLPGWDTMGSLTKKGDSWFTGTKPAASFEQQVTAPPGTTIHFMCAIHPWMHGTITVQPGPPTS